MMMGDDGVRGLGPAHRRQVEAYVRFFKAKRRQHLSEVDAAFDEARDAHVDEADMYSAADVRALTDGVQVLVRGAVEEEMAAFAHQSCLYLRQLYLQAEGQGVSLEVDTAELEDEVLLRGMRELEAEGAARATPVKAPLGRLASLGGGGAGVDVDQVARANELAEANERLRARFERLQEQFRAASAENATLRDEVSRLDGEASGARREADDARHGSAAETAGQAAALRAELTAAKRRADEAQDELQARLNQSAPFVELKRLVQKKNAQLKELRQRVAELTGEQ